MQKGSSWRIPAPLVLALASALLVLAARDWKIIDYWAAAGPGRLMDVAPPLWRMNRGALAGHGIHILQLLWLSFVFVGSGKALAKIAGLRFANAWERAAFAFCLGSGAWAYLFFLLGLLGLLHRPLLVALLAAGLLPMLMIKDAATDEKPSGNVLAGWPARLYLAILVLQLSMLLTFALVPETFYDALEYHLGLPHLYLLQHGIRPTPDNSFSGVPSISSMLFGWALTIDPGGIAAHLLNFSFLPWSAAALIGLASRLGCAEAGLAAAVLFSMVPVVSAASYMTTVELGWGFYQLLCFPAVLSAAESPLASRQRGRWLIAAGLCLGLAISTKYLAWSLPFAVLTLAFGMRTSGSSSRLKARELFLVGLAGAVLLFPWLAKNAAFYRNPIFPFLHERWNPASDVMPGWRYLGAGATLSWENLGVLGCLRQYFSAPWRLIGYASPGESAGPVLLALAPLLLLARLPPPDRLLAWFVLGCWLPLSLVVQLPRYFIPALLPLSLLVALAVSRDGPSRTKGALTAAIVAASLAMGWSFFSWVAPRASWDYFVGRKTAAEFLGHGGGYYPAPLSPAADYLRGHAPKDARVLLFGDSRGFYLPRDHIASTPGQVTVLERWANASSSGADLKARLDAERIGYIVVNHAEIVRQQLALRFSTAGKRSLDDFWSRYTLKEFQAGPEGQLKDDRMILDRWVVVYRVLSEQEALQEHPRDDLFSTYAQE